MAYCWPFSCHTREITGNIFSSELLVYRSAIYPQWKTFKYGLGGRLMSTQSFGNLEQIGRCVLDLAEENRAYLLMNPWDLLFFAQLYKCII